MIGISYDLLDNEAIYQGAEWSKEFQLIDPSTDLPYNLTGYTVESEARKKASDVTATITFTCTVSDATNGIIKLALTHVQTTAIPAGTYKYDVEITEPNNGYVYKAVIPSLVKVVDEYTK